MIGKEVDQSRTTKRTARNPLHDVQIRPTIAFDDHRSPIENGDVPTNQDMVIEGGMCSQTKRLNLIPIGESAPDNEGTTGRMTIDPSQSHIVSEVGCQRQFPSTKVNAGCHAAGVQIIDDMVVADRHSKDRSEDFGTLLLVEAG